MNRLADRFILEREIGSGGMARVFLGRDEVLDRPVAVKMLRPGFVGTDLSDRFQREGRTAARLSHANIVQVYDAGQADFEDREASYIVMEYVSGGDLKERITNSGTLGCRETAHLMSMTARGLAHAHGRGIVHRDIKPHNVLIDSSGNPKLTDFGIARALEATRLTRTGAFLGTAVYSSPEQLKGESITPATDVYAFGITMYQALTGDPPFLGDTPMEVASKHISVTPQPPAPISTMPEPEAGLWRLVLDCLAKDPADRPSAETLAVRLEAIGEYRISRNPQPAPVAAPVARTSERRPRENRAMDDRTVVTPRARARRRGGGRLVAAAAVIAVLCIVGVGAYLSLNREPSNTAGTAQPAGQDPAGGQGESAAGESSPDSTPVQVNQSGDSGSGGSGSGSGGNTSPSAVSAVEDVYEMAASGDYADSYGMLSAGFKETVAQSEAQWSGQFQTLQSIRFLGEPDVEVSGGTATVSGVTEAVHTDRTERNTAVWTLVREGGKWKLDGVQIQAQEIL